MGIQLNHTAEVHVRETNEPGIVEICFFDDAAEGASLVLKVTYSQFALIGEGRVFPYPATNPPKK